jgi:HK97 gp10 family phage protein
MISVDIQGVDELIADFKGYEKEVEKAVKQSVSEVANIVVKDAKERLKSGLQQNPKHVRTSRLLSSIMRKRELEKDQFEAVVGTDVEYAPYIEFGTGDLVEIPEGAESVAALYKGKGIRKVNIKAVSFLNYAAQKNAKKFVEFLEKNLNKIQK